MSEGSPHNQLLTPESTTHSAAPSQADTSQARTGQTPTSREYQREYQREYNKRPEIKKRKAEYRARLEIKERAAVQSAEYRQRPEIKERYKAHFRARNKAHVVFTHKIKMEKGCVDCGYADSGYSLQFDHLPEHEKLYEISRMSGHAKANILKEIEKCEVVCGNCHALRTEKRRQQRKTENET